ncbi:MAG: AraC family transcriptional regulator [Ferruginibacter sp.]
MKLFIKNMVCSRCKIVVRSELEKLGLHPVFIELGEIEIKEKNIDSIKDVLLQNLQIIGFDILDDKRSQTIEKIKKLIIELVHHSEEALKINLSKYISEQLHQNYHHLSNLFTELHGTTIEHYYIAQKIERAKELLVYDELSLSEIAFRLNYSSVAHLSKQFKKVIGLTATQFKQLKIKNRTPIEEL